MKINPVLPFGLQYEESSVVGDFTVPVYDEDEDISVFIDTKGIKVPFVYLGNLGTRTATKVQSEGSDDDDLFTLNTLGTRTITEVREESSDSDDNRYSLSLGTRTGTAVQSEQSDEDADDPGPRPPLTTRTFTHVSKEETDSD